MAEQDKYQVVLAINGGLEILTSFMLDGNAPDVVLAVYVLSRLTNYYKVNDIVVDNGGLEALLDVLQGDIEEARALAAKCITNLATRYIVCRQLMALTVL